MTTKGILIQEEDFLTMPLDEKASYLEKIVELGEVIRGKLKKDLARFKGSSITHSFHVSLSESQVTGWFDHAAFVLEKMFETGVKAQKLRNCYTPIEVEPMYILVSSNDTLAQYTSLNESMKDGIELIEKIIREFEKKDRGYNDSMKINISPKFINKPEFNQTQSQSQTQSVNIWLQELNQTIEEKLKDQTIQPHEKSFLEKVKGGLSTVKSGAELVTLAIGAGTATGLSVDAVMKLLGVK